MVKLRVWKQIQPTQTWSKKDVSSPHCAPSPGTGWAGKWPVWARPWWRPSPSTMTTSTRASSRAAPAYVSIEFSFDVRNHTEQRTAGTWLPRALAAPRGRTGVGEGGGLISAICSMYSRLSGCCYRVRACDCCILETLGLRWTVRYMVVVRV